MAISGPGIREKTLEFSSTVLPVSKPSIAVLRRAYTAG